MSRVNIKTANDVIDRKKRGGEEKLAFFQLNYSRSVGLLKYSKENGLGARTKMHDLRIRDSTAIHWHIDSKRSSAIALGRLRLKERYNGLVNSQSVIGR